MNCGIHSRRARLLLAPSQPASSNHRLGRPSVSVCPESHPSSLSHLSRLSQLSTPLQQQQLNHRLSSKMSDNMDRGLDEIIADKV